MQSISGLALCTAALLDERLASTAGRWAEAATARSSSTRARLHCWTREWTWVVGGGNDDVLSGPKLCSLEEKLRMASTAKPSSTRALLDERMDLGGGRRQRRYPPSFKWDRYCARCGTVSLLDERLTITAGR